MYYLFLVVFFLFLFLWFFKKKKKKAYLMLFKVKQSVTYVMYLSSHSFLSEYFYLFVGFVGPGLKCII